jgi:hypothetical protein
VTEKPIAPIDWDSALTMADWPDPLAYLADGARPNWPPLVTRETRITVTYHSGVVLDGVRHYRWATPDVFEYEVA